MVSKLGFFFWHKLFSIYYTLSGDRLVETPMLMQNLCLKLSLYFNRSYFTGTKMACEDDCWEGDYEECSKMACEDDCWEGDYEEAKEQNGCRISSLVIATKPK
jgi:hypothetical protein